ncbi:MAG: hypothetical protein MK085_13970, partial [Phycisphaerales bacterium]|nr:hypothetical protein [Phycisphaerales bacterium]
MQPTHPLGFIASIALGVVAGTSVSNAEVVFSDWIDSDHFYYYINHMPDFDQKRCDDDEPERPGLPLNGKNHCGPTASANALAYIASHGFPHIAPGVVYDWEAHSNYELSTEFIEQLGVDMETNLHGAGTDKDTMWEVLRDRLRCEFVVKYNYSQRSYSMKFKDLARMAIDGHLILGRHGYYDDFGQTSSGRYKIKRTGGHWSTLAIAWGWDGTQIYTVRDPATDSNNHCYRQGSFAYRSWHVIDREVSVHDDTSTWSFSNLRVQSHLVDPSDDDGRNRYLDAYISIIPLCYYSWGPYDNGLVVTKPHGDNFTPNTDNTIEMDASIADWRVMDFHPSPEGIGGWAMVQSDTGSRRLARINLDTNRLEPVDTGPAFSGHLMTVDRHRRLWIADQQGALNVFWPDEGSLTPVAAFPLLVPPATLTSYEKDVLTVHPDASLVMRWPEELENASPQSYEIPEGVPCQGACRAEVDPVTGNLVLWSEGAPHQLWSFPLDDQGQATAVDIMPANAGVLQEFQFDDFGNLYAFSGGVMY